MTTFEQDAIDFDAVSAPIEGETKYVVWSKANNWRSEENWAEFRHACYAVAVDGRVNPNDVRTKLTNRYGLTIEPRRYSAFWSRAASKNGFLVADGWTTNTDTKGGNAGKAAADVPPPHLVVGGAVPCRVASLAHNSIARKRAAETKSAAHNKGV